METATDSPQTHQANFLPPHKPRPMESGDRQQKFDRLISLRAFVVGLASIAGLHEHLQVKPNLELDEKSGYA